MQNRNSAQVRHIKSERERRARNGIGLAMITESLPTAEASGRTTPKTEDVSEDGECGTLKEHIAKFGDGTTFHGVRFVTDYKLHFLRRLLWMLIVGGMTGYLIYGIVSSTVTFFERPVTSVVRINYVRKIPFPAVTFCNYNQWKKSAVPSDFYDAVRSLNPANTSPVNVTYLESHDVVNLTDKLINSTHRIDDMLLRCSFKAENCSGDNFTRIITDFGVCYSFNSDPYNLRYVHQSGSHNALFLQIDIQQNEYIFGENNAAGIKLLVHPQGQHPLVKELGIAIPPGYETLVGVQLKQLVNLKTPYESNCTDRALKHSTNYTVPLCQYEHKIDVIKGICGCRDMRYPGDEEECPLSKYHGCLLPAEAAFTAADKSFACQVPCNLTIYEARASFAYYPGQHRLEELIAQTNFTENEIRKNILDLRIYFEELSYKQIEEKPSYTFLNLQSSIGGYMGLLIGASLITLFEFLDFILFTTATYLAKYLARKRLKRNRITGTAGRRRKTPEVKVQTQYISK